MQFANTFRDFFDLVVDGDPLLHHARFGLLVADVVLGAVGVGGANLRQVPEVFAGPWFFL